MSSDEKFYAIPVIRQDCTYDVPRGLVNAYGLDGLPLKTSEKIPSCSKKIICPICKQCLSDNSKNGHCPGHHNLISLDENAVAQMGLEG